MGRVRYVPVRVISSRLMMLIKLIEPVNPADENTSENGDIEGLRSLPREF